MINAPSCCKSLEWNTTAFKQDVFVMVNENLQGEKLITVGRILKEWGLNGELIVLPLTFDPARFSKLHEVFIELLGVIEKKRIISVKYHKNNLLIGFEGCGTPEDARRYRGALIKIKESESPRLPDGVYYHYQIIGLNVYTVNGDYLGQIMSIFETGSNDVYVVRAEHKGSPKNHKIFWGGSREYLIPAIKDVIQEIDLEEKKMIVKPMEIEEA